MLKQPLTIASLVLLAITQTACWKKHTSSTSQLPPLTTSGKNTMGCLVNGQLFVPQEQLFNPYPYYGATLSHYPADNLNMFWKSELSSCNQSSIGIRLDSVHLTQGTTFTLSDQVDTADAAVNLGQWATYAPITSCSALLPLYRTTATVTGQITIIYYDATIGIVSGTFWFDALGAAGDTVHIREGRFDMSTQ